jgi:hypothetical protein
VKTGDRRRRPPLVAALVVVAVVLTGCSALRATFDTDQALRRAGFSGARVSTHVNNGFTTVEVTGVSQGDEAQGAAGVVWRTFRYRIDAIVVGTQVFSRGQLQEVFGPRNPAYDRRTIGREFVRLGKAVLFAAGIGGFLLAGGLVLLMVFFVRRGARTNKAFGRSGVI